MAFSLALVDFDGTLADSMPYWLRLPADTLRAAGLPQPEGFAEYIRSVPIREIARDMGAKYPQLEAETPLAVRWSAEMAAHYAREIPLKPGAKKLLQTLRAADLIFTEEIAAAGLNKRLWQYFALLGALPGEDTRVIIALRAMQSSDPAQLAHAARLPFDLLERVTDRIRRERPEVAHVLYDLNPSSRSTGAEW